MRRKKLEKMDEMDEEEHSPLILVLPEFESSGNTANLTKPTRRMVLGDVALRSRGGPGVAMVFAKIEVMRRWWQKLSWC